MKTLTLTIYGPPIAKARHRTARRGSSVASYDPQSGLVSAVKWEIRSRLPKGWKADKRALLVSIDAFFRRPKAHYGTGRNAERLKGAAPAFHAIKPDHSNVVKFYEDCMNQLVFFDDSQIVGFGGGRKHWIGREETERVEIKLEFLE